MDEHPSVASNKQPHKLVRGGAMKMHNPYTSRNMVKTISDFFGRCCEIEKILTNLQEGFQSTSIVGERRIGKSSLLWHITQPEVYKKYLEDSERPYLFAYFDFQRVATLTQGTFFKLLNECITEQIPPDYAPSMEGVENSQDYFRKLVQKAKNDYFIVICLDEFETVVNNEKFDKAFLLSLRSYGNAKDVAYITSSRQTLADICKNTDHLQGSEFWNIFVMPPLYLGLLEPEEAMQLITAPAKNSNIVFEQPEIDYVIELAGCHPLFLEIACFHLFEVKKRKLLTQNKEEIKPLEYKSILDNFLMAATPHFASVWNSLSPPERNVLANSATIDPEGEMKNILTDLTKRGLLCSGLSPRPFSKTFEAYIKEKYSPDRNAVMTSNVSQATKQSINLAVYNEIAHTADSSEFSEEAREFSRLDIWISRNHDVLVNLNGAYTYSEFCPNRAKTDTAVIQRFESRVRNLLLLPDWRAEKYQIGKDVFQYFELTPEVPQAYTGGRAANNDDEKFLITFKCSEEMLAFPFEFINSLSTVEEGGQKHLVLTHPVRRSITGLRTRARPLAQDFYRDKKIKILLINSNVSGPVNINGRDYQLPPIPGARKEVEQIEAMIKEGQKEGRIRCSLDVKHDVTCEDMADILRRGKYDVIHFSGHAMYSEVPESSSLFFWRKTPEPKTSIGMLTTNQLNFYVEGTNLKFFYLSCCQGAMAGTAEHLLNNDFLGITHALLAAGVPSVMAMRWPLNDEMAPLLASSFYEDLFNGKGLELSLFHARRHLQSSRPNDHSWLSPILVIQDS
jgi:hypothetical protein